MNIDLLRLKNNVDKVIEINEDISFVFNDILGKGLFIKSSPQTFEKPS